MLSGSLFKAVYAVMLCTRYTCDPQSVSPLYKNLWNGVINIKKISIILIIAGVLIAAIPVAGQLYSKYQEKRMMEEWLNSIDASELEDDGEVDAEAAYTQLQDVFGAEAGSGESAGDDGSEVGTGTGIGAGEMGYGDAGAGDTGNIAESGSEGSTDESVGTEGSGVDSNGDSGSGCGKASGSGIDGQKVLGVIQISKIKVNEPIIEGVSRSNLRAGIGHIRGTAALGQPGNCALAGHRNYAFKKLFNRLDELKIGDEIRITTKKEYLTYKVTKTQVVKPNNVSVLKGSRDKNIITLITCTPKYVASHRLIVTAELTERVLREP